MENHLDDILENPCLFCGYNGGGYWMIETHDKRCPWHHVGGIKERKETIFNMIKKALLKVYGCKRSSRGEIGFYLSENEEIVRLEANGDIHIRGKLVTNDIEVVDGMRSFLKEANQITK